MVQKGIFWTIGEHLYFVYYPIISYQWIKVYPLVGVRKNYYSGPRVLHSKNTLHYKVSGKMSSIRHV